MNQRFSVGARNVDAGPPIAYPARHAKTFWKSLRKTALFPSNHLDRMGGGADHGPLLHHGG